MAHADGELEVRCSAIARAVLICACVSCPRTGYEPASSCCVSVVNPSCACFLRLLAVRVRPACPRLFFHAYVFLSLWCEGAANGRPATLFGGPGGNAALLRSLAPARGAHTRTGPPTSRTTHILTRRAGRRGTLMLARRHGTVAKNTMSMSISN